MSKDKMSVSQTSEVQSVENKPLVNMLKENMKEASYTVTAQKLTSGTKEILMKTLFANSNKEGAAAIMASPVGDAVVGMVLSLALVFTPKVNKDHRAKKLANHFQQHSFVTVGNQALSVLENTVATKVLDALENLD